ncbi:MAG: GspH/FimT family pseudopilin [Methylococcales bacterium]|nr:GspH/FimT family pseudopilin [Methylococcales bacterium]
MYNHSKPASGFTLLELIVAISIAGILMAMAIPSFSDMMRNNRLTTYANELVTSLNLARSEAVKRGIPVTTRKITCTTGTYWSSCGWNVFVDDGGCSNSTNLAVPPPCVTTNNGNGVLDANEQLLRTYDKLPDNFSLIGNSSFVNRVTYQADGTTNNTGGSFSLCDNSDGNINKKLYKSTSRLIIISTIGRVRMGKDTDNDELLEKDGGTETSTCATP